ncbi:unnamed protein product [Ectocarpus sp. 12 AP-2014]
MKAVMAKTDQEVLRRQDSFLELPDVMRRANKTLKASIKLIGLRLPKASGVKRITVEGFPPSRLHNAVIVTAPGMSVGHGHHSVDDATLGARARLTPTTPMSRRHQMRHQQRLGQLQLQQHQQPPPPPPQQQQPATNPNSCAPSPTRSEEQAAAKARGSQADEVAAAAAAGQGGPGCCRAASAWDEEKSDRGRGPADTAPGAPEACSHCACACRADEVWAAYRTLRKRYQALKSHADKEELRVSAEEQCREMQSELGRQRVKMEAEFDEKRSKMNEDLVKIVSEIHAELYGNRGNGVPAAAGRGHKEAEAGTEGLGITQVDLQSLRDVVQASFKESQAVKKESSALREKVAIGEECLHDALQESLSLREEIARRKQHGEVLLARIRFLQGQASAHVQNSAKRREGDPRSPADSTCDSDSHSEPISRPRNMGSRRRHASDTHRRRQQEPPPDTDTDMDTDSDESDDSTVHHYIRPAPFTRRFSSNSYDEDGYMSPPSLERARARPRPGGATGRHPPSQGARPGGAVGRYAPPQATQEASWGGGRHGSTHLEREHEDLTHEVYELSARLASSRTKTTTSYSAAAAAPAAAAPAAAAASLDPFDFERRHLDGGASFGTSAAASDGSAGHWHRRRSQPEESVTVRAVDRVARTTATWRASRGGAHFSGSSSDHPGGDWGPVPRSRARAHARRPLVASGSGARSSSVSGAFAYESDGGSWQLVGPPKRHSRAADELPGHRRQQRRRREPEGVSSSFEGRSVVRGGGGDRGTSTAVSRTRTLGTTANAILVAFGRSSSLPRTGWQRVRYR